jgi:PAS domain S-box-containing protein
MSDVLENIAEAFYSVDADFNFIYVNRNAEEIWGRPHHSLEGKNLWQEFPQLVGTEIYEKHKLALKEKQPIHFETRPISGEGLLNISLYPDKSDGLSCLFRDITGRRKTETEALLREEQLRLIVESATDYAIFSIDDKGRVTSWNTGAQNTFGYTRDEMMGQLTDILFIPEDRRRKVPQLEMKTALDKGRSEDERWHLRKDGTQFFASGVMQPLRSDGVLGFVKICRDQTDKLEAQTAIRERGMLKRLVEAQEEERQRIARDLHDNMGQHLTALRLKLEGLKANYAAEPAMMKAIDETQAQAKRVDDEVSFMTWELRPTALDNLGLKNALGNFVKEWSKNYGVDAEFHSARSRRTRLTPEAEINLYRIAQEALNNVVKHAKASKADVMLEYGQESVVLVIEDNGQGFDVKAAERTSKKSKRLGLVGMRERAALLGGTLEIESARLKGTTVIARIPVRIAGAR